MSCRIWQAGPKVASSIDYNMASTFARKTVRTMEDGPTTKQKVMVSFIWIGSAFFGITTCFPDKVFGVALSQKIKEDQGGRGLTFQPQNKQQLAQLSLFPLLCGLLIGGNEMRCVHIKRMSRPTMTCKSFEHSRCE